MLSVGHGKIWGYDTACSLREQGSSSGTGLPTRGLGPPYGGWRRHIFPPDVQFQAGRVARKSEAYKKDIAFRLSQHGIVNLMRGW
jgi:hypothetical protein